MGVVRSAGIVVVVAVAVGVVTAAVIVGWFLYVMGQIIWALLFPRGPGSND